MQQYFFRHLIIGLISLGFSKISFSQTISLVETENDLVKTYSKIFPFYYENPDSLEFYSNLFTTKMNDCIDKYPQTISYPFQKLKDSNACEIVTSADTAFRIYSWDTWLGGTMHFYKNIFQFKSGNKVYTTNLGYEEGDIGSYFTDIFTLQANNKKYYLSISIGSESSKDKYEIIKAYSIEKSTLIDSVPIFKTPKGLINSISIEYDFFTVVDRPERPLRLIKYDANKKIIYIPVIVEEGRVTNRFILYRFNGKYFERVIAKKMKKK